MQYKSTSSKYLFSNKFYNKEYLLLVKTDVLLLQRLPINEQALYFPPNEVYLIYSYFDPYITFNCKTKLYYKNLKAFLPQAYHTGINIKMRCRY